MKQLTISISKIFDEFEKEQCKYSKHDFIDWDNYQKLKQQIMQKFNEMDNKLQEFGKDILALEQKNEEERQRTIDMIDKRIEELKKELLPPKRGMNFNYRYAIKKLIQELQDLKRRVERE